MAYSDQLIHYGVLGMKWGVRKDDKGKLGVNFKRMTKDERTERKELIRKTTAAQRNLKRTSQNADDFNQARDKQAETYRKALAKTVFPWNRKKKQRLIDQAGERLAEITKELEIPESKRIRANKYAQEQTKRLVEFGEKMNEKYGSYNIRQIQTKNTAIGKSYAYDFIKTGINMASIPVIGNWTTAKYVAEWDSERRWDIEERRATNLENNRYYGKN